MIAIVIVTVMVPVVQLPTVPLSSCANSDNNVQTLTLLSRVVQTLPISRGCAMYDVAVLTIPTE